MKKRILLFIAPLLLLALIVPAALFMSAPRAHADSNLCIVGVAAGIAAAVANLIWTVPSGDIGSAGGSWTGAGGSVGDCIYNSIIVPMLRGLIRNFLQQMTQSTINWINGNGNPSGQRSFVPNLSVNLQGVGDAAAMAFLNQVSVGFQSPFDMNIAAALRRQYLQQTSLGGFFSQFKSTLTQSSPNINSFLGGDWSQGGVQTWIALTTQPQNNPYLLYEAAANKLAAQVSDAQTNRRQDLLQSGGFLSFCPPGTNSGGNAANPQAQCTTSDGTPAMATTPGSVIMSFLQTNVNSGVGQLVTAQDLDSALFAVVQALTSKVLNSTGLFSVSSNTGSGGGGGGGGGGGTTPTGGGSTGGASLAQTVLTNISTYTTSWNAVQSAAVAAQTSVQTVSNSCSTELAQGIIGGVPMTSADVQNALTNEITPVLQQVQTALGAASSTAAFAQQVINEANSPTTDPAQLSTDLQTLLSMPPIATDLATAEMNAKVTNQARATPSGSLTVSGGSMVDQMNLIATNANTLAPQCAGYTPTGTTGANGTAPINGGPLLNAYTGSGVTYGQLVKYVAPAANQVACFSATFNSQDVDTVRQFFWTTTPQITGGNITSWVSATFNGADIGGTLKNQIFGGPSGNFTNLTNFTVPSATTYYWCLKIDKDGNNIGVQLWPGNPPSGGA